MKDLDPSQIEIDTSYSSPMWKGPAATAGIFLQILDLTSITEQKVPTVVGKVDNWFVRNGVIDSTRIPFQSSNPLYHKYCDTMLVYGLYMFLLKLCYSSEATCKWMKVAVNARELSEVDADQRVSRDFLNRLDHMMTALFRGKLTLESAKHHCFFMDPSQVLLMLQVFTEIPHQITNKFVREFELQRYILHKTMDTHLYYDGMEEPAVLSDSKAGLPLYDWRVRLGSPVGAAMETELQAYVRKNRVENRITAAARSAGSTSTYTFGTQNTFYNPCSPYSLVKMVRNLRVHWATVDAMVRREICPGVSGIDEEFSHFFTSRFPNLVTTIFNAMALIGSHSAGGIHHSVMNLGTWVSRKGFQNYNADENSRRQFGYDNCVDPVPNFPLPPLQPIYGWVPMATS